MNGALDDPAVLQQEPVRLVLSQRWSHERYTRWLADAITSALCAVS